MTRQFTCMLLLLAIGGCRDTGDPVGPHGEVTSVYVLRSIDGVSLPAPGNGDGMTDFTVIADTVRVYEDGHGVEVMVTSRPGVSGVQRQEQPLQLTSIEGTYLEGIAYDIEYPCQDQPAASMASCLAPPHHRAMVGTNGMIFTNSKMYRVPMVFERVGPM